MAKEVVLAKAKVSVIAETEKHDKNIDKSKAKVKGFGKETEKMSTKAKAAWALVAAGAAGAVYELNKAVNVASDLEEATSKFNTVFSSQMSLANDWAKELNKSYGQSTREAKENLGAIQDLLVPMGLAEKQAGKLSFEVVKLATDLGSFNNKMTPQVIDDYQSALVGNFETMKKYGVVLNATVVAQQALQMGLKKTKSELTASDKAMAAHELIVKGSNAAIGDFIRTSDGYANTTKELDAAWEDFAGTLGNKFLHVATQIKSITGGILKDFEQMLAGPSLQEQINAVKNEIESLSKVAIKSSEASISVQERQAKQLENLKNSWMGALNAQADMSRGSINLAEISIPDQTKIIDTNAIAIAAAQKRLNDLLEKQKNDASEKEKIRLKAESDAKIKELKRLKDIELQESASLYKAREAAELKYNDFLLSHMDKTSEEYQKAFMDSEKLKWSKVKGLTKEELENIGEITRNEFEKVGDKTGDSFNNFSGNISSSIGIMRDLFEEGSNGFRDMTTAILAMNEAQKVSKTLADKNASSFSKFSVIAQAIVVAVKSLDSYFNKDIDLNYEEIQAAQGLGTVFGFDDKKTNSIVDSLELIADTNEEIVNINTKMLTALATTVSGITLLSRSILREVDSNNISPLNKEMNLLSDRDAFGLHMSPSGWDIGERMGIEKYLDMGEFSRIGSQISDEWAIFTTKYLEVEFFTGIQGIRKLFGGSSASDKGVNIVSGVLSDLIENTTASAYQVIKYKNWRYGSTHTKTDTIGLSQEINDEFEAVFSSMASAVSEGALLLGISGGKIQSVFDTWVVDFNISTKGMNADDQIEAINSAFSQIFDNLTTEIVPWLTNMSREGEGLGETLSRVTTNMALYSKGVELFGWQAQKVPSILGENSMAYMYVSEYIARNAEALVDLAGGAEMFASKMSNFYSNFATEDQQFKLLEEGLTESLEAVGLKLPETRQGFFDLMEGLDDTTEASRAQIATMLSVTDGVSEYIDALEDQEEATAGRNLLKSNIDSYIGGNERQDWGVTEWSEEFSNISDELRNLDDAADTYNDESLELLTDQFEILQKIHSIQESQLNALENTSESLVAQVEGLQTSDGMPISKEYYEGRYSELLAAAKDMGDNNTLDTVAISSFQNFVDDYIDVMSTLGKPQNDLINQASKDLLEINELVQSDMDTLSAAIKLNTEATIELSNSMTVPTVTELMPEVVTGSDTPWEFTPPEVVTGSDAPWSVRDEFSIGGYSDSHEKGSREPMTVNIVLDGKVLASTMIDQSRTNPDYQTSIRKMVQ